MASVEALGGIKQWIGEPRKYKVSIHSPRDFAADSPEADAQNTTLVRCIAEDALAWVLDPVLEVPPDGEADDIGRSPCSTAATHAETVTLAHSGTAFPSEAAVQACSPQTLPEASFCRRRLATQSPDTTLRGEDAVKEAGTGTSPGGLSAPGRADP